MEVPTPPERMIDADESIGGRTVKTRAKGDNVLETRFPADLEAPETLQGKNVCIFKRCVFYMILFVFLPENMTKHVLFIFS